MSLWDRMGDAGQGSGDLPPGQHERDDFPVLHEGEVPVFHPESWDLRLDGAVERPMRFTLEELRARPNVEQRSDFHCVETWSRRGLLWAGVSLAALIEEAGPAPEARFVTFHCDGGYTTDLPLEEATREGTLLAWGVDGQDLTPEHGRPLRAVIPHLYAWKSAKWIRRVELHADPRPGFWERAGYHDRGDVWAEERRQGDGEP